MKHFFTAFLLFIIGAYQLVGQEAVLFTGVVSDPTGSPLAYASVSVNEATYGTVSDHFGRFQLRLPAGNYEIRVSYLGHRTVTDVISLQQNLEKNYTLAIEQFTLEDVIITDDGRDPAYAIMQLAINNKDQNEIPFPEYKYHAYTKSAFRFREGFDPDSLMFLGPLGRRKEPKEGEEEAPAELKSELLYLAENVSEVYVRAPKDLKEEILSSQVSGDRREFSVLGAAFNRFNPYENRTVLEGIADRGIISPLSNNAFFSYRYKLLGTIQDEEGKSYKIQVTPKRELDPVYTGTVYIADSSYAVKELNWVITRKQQLRFIDTIQVNQTYQRIDNAWLPIQTRIGFAVDFSLFGLDIPIQGFTQSLLSEYETDPVFEEKLFGREIIAISDSALDQDSSYWSAIRPIPLTGDEVRDYAYKDSLEIVQNSPAYLDSLTEARRKIGPLDILINGWGFTNYRAKTSWQGESMLETLGFNPMEGFFVAPSVAHIWDWEESGSLSIGGRVRYGFADEQLGGRMRIRWRSNPKVKESWLLEGGRYPQEYSSMPQIDPFLNLAYSMVYHESYIRLYRASYGKLQYERELFNGFQVQVGMSHERRDTMANHTEYSLFQEEGAYLNNLGSSRFLVGANATIFTLSFQYQPFNRYISTPDGRIDLGSAWPNLEGTFRQALGEGDQTVAYSALTLGLSQRLNLKALGTTRWKMRAGTFLHEDRVELPDVFHFKGNETVFRGLNFDQFYLLPYYGVAGTEDFLEGHAEHAFGGYILNKIPLIRRLKLNEYVGVHALWQEGTQPYAEVNFGVEARVFRFLPIRVDANLRLTDGSKWGWKMVVP